MLGEKRLMRPRFLVSSLTIAAAFLIGLAMVEQGLAGCSCTKQPAIYGPSRPSCAASECYVHANFGKPGSPERGLEKGAMGKVVEFAAGQRPLKVDEIRDRANKVWDLPSNRVLRARP
jgi:hypothetical protein